LGEVAVPNNKPVGLSGKGKEKEAFDDVVIKAKGVTTRAPLRTVAATRQAARAGVKKASHEELIGEENAMAVDPPSQAVLPSITVRRSSLLKETQGITAHHPDVPHRASRFGLVSKHQPDDDFERDQPALKKRRTSSVPPEEDPVQAEEEGNFARITAEMEAFAELPEVDPESSPWEDLDAVDINDPLMVSEYVQDIFQYLKHIEVRYFVYHELF
jgi:G2/mitotic-specific cyclin 2